MRKKLAEQLSQRLGGEWKAVRDGFGWEYHGPAGRIVRQYSESKLDFDGYSDTEFVTVYIDNAGAVVGRCGVIY